MIRCAAYDAAEEEKRGGMTAMMILIVGGSGCGKSAYAEKRIMELSLGGEARYYLATMQVYGEEGRAKVQRHVELRKNKGMLTIEQTRDVSEALPKMQKGPKVVLLEDLGNLVANEMFLEDGTVTPWETAAEKIVMQLRQLNSHLDHLVIVSNNVFEDGIEYEEGTRDYLRALGKVNAELAGDATQVVEVVAGIPLMVKDKG